MSAETPPTLEQKSRWLAWGMKALAASLSIGRVGHDSPDSRANQQKALASLISNRSDLASLAEHLPDRVSTEVLVVLDAATRLFGRWSLEDSAAAAELALKSRGVAALLDAYANGDTLSKRRRPSDDYQAAATGQSPNIPSVNANVPTSSSSSDPPTAWTRPMSKLEAARYLKCPHAKKADWINQCVKDGTLKIRTDGPQTRQSKQYNLDAFPPEMQDKLRAISPN